MNLGAVDSCPLLNDYKQRLLWSRLPQSILGGLRYCFKYFTYKRFMRFMRFMPRANIELHSYK